SLLLLDSGHHLYLPSFPTRRSSDLLPGIRRREVEYGVAFDKAQWIWMGILIIGSIILDIWLGSTKLPMRIALIVIEAVVALILTWLVGRRKPANATK